MMRTVIRGVLHVYSLVRPPERWQAPVAVALGVIAGIGLLVLHASKAPSYLSDEPRVCINCHIMVPQYAAWAHSSHERVATCNDCHVPHDSFVRHWAFKGTDGMRHSAIFTARGERQAIVMLEAGRETVQGNCVRCHGRPVQELARHGGGAALERPCWDCHRSTPHGRVRSLSSAPLARAPLLGRLMPGWAGKLLGGGAAGGAQQPYIITEKNE